MHNLQMPEKVKKKKRNNKAQNRYNLMLLQFLKLFIKLIKLDTKDTIKNRFEDRQRIVEYIYSLIERVKRSRLLSVSLEGLGLRRVV